MLTPHRNAIEFEPSMKTIAGISNKATVETEPDFFLANDMDYPLVPLGLVSGAVILGKDGIPYKDT